LISKFLIDGLLHNTNRVIDSKNCILIRYRNGQCNKCTSYCPKGAIEVGIDIAIDNNLCDECGICAGVCPTQVFYKAYDLQKLINYASSYETIVITCFANKKDYGIGWQRINCLASLQPQDMLLMSLAKKKGNLAFDLRYCLNCSQCIAVKDKIKNDLKLAEYFLNYFSDKKKFTKLIKDDTNVASGSNVVRRQFFNFFKDETKDIVKQVARAILVEKKLESKPISETNMLAERQYLLECLEKEFGLDGYSRIPVEHSLGWVSPYVEIGCDGCELCVNMCGQKAWQGGIEDNQWTLTHQMGLCRGCGICIGICPKSCIKKSDTFDYSDLFYKVIKYTLKTQKCASCQDALIITSEKVECNKCLQKRMFMELDY
jgi:ferredoxin